MSSFEKIHKSVLTHFIDHQRPIGIFGDRLHGGHLKIMLERTERPLRNLVDHLKDKVIEGGSVGSGGLMRVSDVGRLVNKARNDLYNDGGSIGSGGSFKPDVDEIFDKVHKTLRPEVFHRGGSIHTGGALAEDEPPKDNKQLYHYALNLTPQQFELIREIANQILGAKPSPMWGPVVDKDEQLQSNEEEYEKIIDMPNTHATARLIEAGHGHGKGGGFANAFRHVTKIATKVYKAGRGVVQWANKNKDILLPLIPEDYRSGAEAFLETAGKIDDAVNPIVDAAISAVRENATQEDKQKLKQLARQSIDKAVETHLPQAKKYLDEAQEAYNVYSTGDKNKMMDYATKKTEEAINKYAPQATPYLEVAKDAKRSYDQYRKPLTAN